jgi:hypothetical protein
MLGTSLFPKTSLQEVRLGLYIGTLSCVPFYLSVIKFELVCESSHSIRGTRHDIDLQERKVMRWSWEIPLHVKLWEVHTCQYVVVFVILSNRSWKVENYTRQSFFCSVSAFLFSKSGSTYIDPALACMSWNHPSSIHIRKLLSLLDSCQDRCLKIADQSWLQSTSR